MTGAGDSCWFLNVISGAGNPSAVPGDCWNQWHTVPMIWCHLPVVIWYKYYLLHWCWRIEPCVDDLVVMSMGDPWVEITSPAPIPGKTCAHGCGCGIPTAMGMGILQVHR